MAIPIGRVAVAATLSALALAGCGGADDGGLAGGETNAAAGDGCATATESLRATVRERDRLTVDQRISEMAQACTSEQSDEDACLEARNDMAVAAAEDEPPADLDARIDQAVAVCAGQQFTATFPAP